MTTSIRRARAALAPAAASLALLLPVLLSAPACTRDKTHASADECRKACARVGDLKNAALHSAIFIEMHELDERVEGIEDRARRETANIKAEMSGGVPFGDKALLHMTAEARAAALERHRFEERQLKLQREAALQRLQDSVVSVKREYEETKAKAAAQEQKASAEAMNQCYEPCLQRPAAQVRCWLRVQALEDVAICDRN